MNETIYDLLALSHDIGREDRGLAILGEGNTSKRLSDGRFAVKASGACLATLANEDVTECHLAPLVKLLDESSLSDETIAETLMASRVATTSKKPSIEAVFHAWLLTLEDVHFVGHCHPVAVNQILCSPRARKFATQRQFPDEVVCCGPASVFVPYLDPGLPLAQGIRDATLAFQKEHNALPRIILLENHGLIAIGRTPQAVLAAILMAEKAAQIFIGAATLGGPQFLTPAQVQRIGGRADEAHRQRQLKM